ncbi:sigma-70 family RNA polymerase sigma factor [Pararhodobacter sp. SW119]|uniref:sigma-70 family RNA polymerase sigma factor n=1 Tax=Pararhodobacter sp. SW119 TaxID=2780075 RepID=UPI001AE00748|nr:sigma-70 family RNA polymerase sigma factor [Pararhodobacter sp. SW119]
METVTQGATDAQTGSAPTRHAALDALMRAAQAGDERAYRALLEEVALRMRRLVCARAPWLGRADVEDIVQDILLALHSARATWDPARPFMPWIAGIARNRLADHARRYVRRQAFDEAAQDLAEVFSTTPGQTHAEGVVNLMSVRRAMDGLTSGERDAFELVRLRQMSLAEAATKRGSTVGAMKVAVHRATLKLRAAVGRDGKE